MNITWNTRRENSICTSSYAFASVNKLKQAIRQTKTVCFVAQHNTITSLDIEISCPNDEEGSRHSFNVAYIPAGAEKFKFLNKVLYRVFDSEPHERHFFKIGKKQGLPELKEYLSLVLEELLPNMDELNAEIVLYRLPEIKI